MNEKLTVKVEGQEEENYFVVLNNINVNDKVEEKNKLTYLSWAYAWGEVKKLHPLANYKIYENNDGWNYFTDGRTGWVKTGVIINNIEHIEYLPIMDFRNNSIPLEKISSFDVNKAIQRSLTKAIGRHGLGLYIYAGEDLPEEEKKEKEDKVKVLESPMTSGQAEIINNLDDEKKKVIVNAYGSLNLTISQAGKVIENLKKKGLL